ncbi:MAG: DUF4058 family protein [Chloroflexota bacterium]
MPSPFPGMNPYLEDPTIWEDFHQSLATEIRDQLAPNIEPRYIAALTPRVTYEEVVIAESPRNVKPDVGVWRTSAPASGALATVAIAPPPLVAPIAYELPLRLWSVEIRDTALGTLVTSIEILSPVNKKPGHEAFDTYQRKRRDLMRASVNLLEIDLLRAGRRVPTLTAPLPNAPYFVFLYRAERQSQLAIWPLRLPEPIPTLPVPLREPDPDVPLELGVAIQNIYQRARYGLRIDYTTPPPKPDLSPADAAWVDAQLAAVR